MNLRDRLPTENSAQGTSGHPSPEQLLLSKTQEMQSVIADLKDELSKVQQLNRTISAEREQLAQENVVLKSQQITQESRMMKAEQTIHDQEAEIDKLRDMVDLSNIEAVRRARMELLIIQHNRHSEITQCREEAAEKIRQISADYLKKVDAARKAANDVKTIMWIVWILFLLVLFLMTVY